MLKSRPEAYTCIAIRRLVIIYDLFLMRAFKPLCFRNEIIWKRTTAHSSAKKYAPVHDVIFYYVKSDAHAWNSPRVDYTEEYLDRYYNMMTEMADCTGVPIFVQPAPGKATLASRGTG